MPEAGRAAARAGDLCPDGAVDGQGRFPRTIRTPSLQAPTQALQAEVLGTRTVPVSPTEVPDRFAVRAWPGTASERAHEGRAGAKS